MRSEKYVTYTVYTVWVEGGTFNVKPGGHKVAIEFTWKVSLL